MNADRTVNERIARYRQRMTEKGMVVVRVWVPPAGGHCGDTAALAVPPFWPAGSPDPPEPVEVDPQAARGTVSTRARRARRIGPR